MKLSKTLITASVATLISAAAASALTVEQCEELGGTVDLIEAECELNAAQEDEARALGWLPGGSGGTTAALGGVAVGGAGAAAVGGLILAVVLTGGGGSTTTTTGPGSS
jgi:hypothetical protein